MTREVWITEILCPWRVSGKDLQWNKSASDCLGWQSEQAGIAKSDQNKCEWLEGRLDVSGFSHFQVVAKCPLHYQANHEDRTTDRKVTTRRQLHTWTHTVYIIMLYSGYASSLSQAMLYHVFVDILVRHFACQYLPNNSLSVIVQKRSWRHFAQLHCCCGLAALLVWVRIIVPYESEMPNRVPKQWCWEPAAFFQSSLPFLQEATAFLFPHHVLLQDKTFKSSLTGG